MTHPVAPGHVVAICVPGHLPRMQAVINFRGLFSQCDWIWQYGQFCWKQLVAAVAPSGTANQSAVTIHNRCHGFIASNKLADIEPWIRANVVWDDKLLRALAKLGEDRCYADAGTLARFVRDRGGLQGCFGRAGEVNRSIYSGSECPGHPPNKPNEPVHPWYQLVRYNKDGLRGWVRTLKDMLDAGYIVPAGVMSGTNDNKGLHDPDHYVLILGYDVDEFVYWDPDSLVSNREPFGPTFGTLTHYHAGHPAFQAANYPSAQGDNFHRLGNTNGDAELQCDLAGNFWLTTPSTISHPRGSDVVANYGFPGNNVDFRFKNHRYQITHLYPKV